MDTILYYTEILKETFQYIDYVHLQFSLWTVFLKPIKFIPEIVKECLVNLDLDL